MESSKPSSLQHCLAFRDRRLAHWRKAHRFANLPNPQSSVTSAYRMVPSLHKPPHRPFLHLRLLFYIAGSGSFPARLESLHPRGGTSKKTIQPGPAARFPSFRFCIDTQARTQTHPRFAATPRERSSPSGRLRKPTCCTHEKTDRALCFIIYSDVNSCICAMQDRWPIHLPLDAQCGAM